MPGAQRVRQRHPFEIVAWIALPDHLHAIWTLPRDDADCSARWAWIKAGFSRRIERGRLGFAFAHTNLRAMGSLRFRTSDAKLRNAMTGGT
jgi:REP element-mobilizing transposase RayT